ncbi:hypothetical protein A9Q84_06910 [Halobacteriovorax marinus]|uniref:Cytochrome c domain-containing protein n=1 Tax=Halobacteriovorax marinus TaxID=97084 RepID=A0A1Y5F9R3_9BACT|nr:hypothetical protein A9Q84_06910 [Halobacteriovorax marinus]
MKTLKAFVVLITLLSSQSFAADAARGQKLFKSCVQCHGADGAGIEKQKAPRIAGQHEWYIISSIKQFKAGKERKNPPMLPFIKKLSNTDIADLAAYISTLK